MPEKKPNIIFILADDMGEWAMGCSGNQEIHTPNLDRLAASGMRFDNFYCVSPVCSPARASLLTGKIPSAHGVFDWIRSGNIERSALPDELKEQGCFKDENKAVAYLENQSTYTAQLADSGYELALSGKWHLGDSLRPQCGFSHWFTIARGGTSYMTADVVEDGQISIREGEYLSDLITERALAFLENRDTSRPYYLAVHYTAPHSPWDEQEHPGRFIELYRDCPFNSCPDLEAHPWQVPSAPIPDKQHARAELLRGYYASITAMDEGVGKIMDACEEETLIIFMSDNGMNMGHHGIWGKGNGTYPLNMYDSSVKIPCLMRWTGRIPAAVVSSDIHSQYDILHTLLDLSETSAGYPLEGLPGRSMRATLLGGKAPACAGANSADDEQQAAETGDKVAETGHAVVFDEYGATRMIRSKRYKLVCRLPEGPDEFYDLAADADECHNLIDSAELKQTIADFREQLGDWFARYVNPELDGTKEGVTGFGQLRRGGIYSDGSPGYAPIPKA